MNKHLLIGFLSTIAVLTTACFDDSVPGTTSKLPCDQEGTTSCSAIGELLVCTNGFFEPQNCGEKMACRTQNGIAECAETCVPEHFPVTCGGPEGIRTCNNDGFVDIEPCEPGNFCYDAMCIDESKTECDNTFPIQCRNTDTVLQCKRGWVVSRQCNENQICQDGICITAKPCDPTTFTSDCADQNTMTICANNVEIGVKCGEGKLCHHGQCTDDCDEGYSACSATNNTLFYCDQGKIKESPCTGGTCANGQCVGHQECNPDRYAPVCTADGKLQTCTQAGQLHNETCTNNFECYNGACVSDPPCNTKTFTPVCTADGQLQTCVDNHKNTQPCPDALLCENGVCQDFSEPCTEEGAVQCGSDSIVKTCQNGYWHQSTCQYGTEVCIAGVCTDSKTAVKCNEASYTPSCNINTVLTCEFGYVTKRECASDQHCDAGICFDNIQEGDTCNPDTFVQQCLDDGSTAVCLSGVITKVSCGEQRCVAGACIDKTCDQNFVPECRGNFEVTACIDDIVSKVACPPNTHCSNGQCLPDANPGDPCTPETFSPSCNNEGKQLTCQVEDGNATIHATPCTGDTPECLNGTCVACNPNTFTQTCTPSGNANVGPLKTTCNPDGSLNQQLCALNTVCFNNECAQCNPATSKPSCINSSTSQICKADGTFESKACANGEQCIDGTGCTKACDANGNCASAHYVCVNNVCIFQPECTTSATPICHDTKSYKICEAPGIYSTPTPCNSNEKCENGKCVGNECDPATYGTQCSGNFPTTCVNGYITKAAACNGATPYCVNGACKACKHGETLPTCSGNNAYICAANHTIISQACSTNEMCKAGEGCVSKCPGFTGDSCNAEGQRVYCSDTGVISTETCDFTETCIAGTCQDRTGNGCNRDTFNNTCHNTSTGAVLEYCHSNPLMGIQFRSCNSSSSVCATINGETDCFIKCSSPNATTCGNFSQDLMEGVSSAQCNLGTDTNGNQAYGWFPRLGICREYGNSSILYSSSCHLEGTNIEHNVYVCESMGRGTCDPNTGACTGAVECTDADTKCDGLTAKSCEYDPALGKNVLISMDCSTYGDKTCVTYAPKGKKRALCKGTETYNNATPAYSVSSLGTCNADGKDPNVLHTLHYLSSTHFGFYSTTCSSGCETKTENGITYAYCK